MKSPKKRGADYQVTQGGIQVVRAERELKWWFLKWLFLSAQSSHWDRSATWPSFVCALSRAIAET